jgi:AraC family transcriptional regulator, regulatory protein of adaptative response / DNA-3-methyladenine glycosylase II
MLLDFDSCYSALRSHDPRFDGLFYVAVSSTRIYCRPVCNGRAVKKENCTFYPSAAAAEAAGYRPCLRCRPEKAPGNAQIDAVSRLAAKASSRIDDGALTEGSVADLAAELLVSERHLRRILKAEYGVTPVELAQTHRLLMAKRLLTDTALPIGEIAFASGFNSLRRFNTLFSERYRMPPTRLRNNKKVASSATSLTSEIAYKPPLDWQALLSFLSMRALPGVEIVTTCSYARTVDTGRSTGWIVVEPLELQNRVRVVVSISLAADLQLLIKRVKRLFDLTADSVEIDAYLGDIAKRRPGLRVPGSFDGFETAVRAILGQRISVKAATTLSGRLVSAFGIPVDSSDSFSSGITYLWPSANTIAALSVSDIASLGVIARSAEAIILLAKMVDNGELSLEPTLDPDPTMYKLKSLPGVGEWTAQYIAMRVLRSPDSFPNGDLAIAKAMGIADKKHILSLAEQWRPWRSYAAIHLWQSLENIDVRNNI